MRRSYIEFDLQSVLRLGGQSVFGPDTSTGLSLYLDADHTLPATLYVNADPALTNTLTQPASPGTFGRVSGYVDPDRVYYWVAGSGSGELYASAPQSALVLGGTSDDTLTFQAALDRGEPWLVLQAGETYTLTETTLPATLERLSMYGATVQHKALGDGLGMFSTTAGLGPLLVEGGTILGIAGDGINIADSAFYLDPTVQTIGEHDRVTFRDVAFEHLQGNAVFGRYFHTFRFERCRVTDCSLGLNIGPSRAVWIESSEFDGNQYTGTSTGVAVALNTVPYPADLVSDDQIRSAHIRGCSFRNLTHHQSVLLHGGMTGELSGCLFDQCSAPVGMHPSTGAEWEGHQDFIISSNVLIGADTYGDSTHGSLYTLGFINNGIDVSGYSADNETARIRIEHNIIRHFGYGAEAAVAGHGASTGGIYSNGFIRQVVIRSNLITDCYGHGMLFRGQVTDVAIDANDISALVLSGTTKTGIEFLDGGGTPTVTGWLTRNHIHDASVGISQSNTTIDASGLYCEENTFPGTTTGYLTAGTTPMQTPYLQVTSSPITPDPTVLRRLRVSMNGDVTVNVPTVKPETAAQLTVEVYNPGTLGTVTWTGWHMAGSFTKPGAGATRSITFQYDRTRNEWREIGRTAADMA